MEGIGSCSGRSQLCFADADDNSTLEAEVRKQIGCYAFTSIALTTDKIGPLAPSDTPGVGLPTKRARPLSHRRRRRRRQLAIEDRKDTEESAEERKQLQIQKILQQQRVDESHDTEDTI